MVVSYKRTVIGRAAISFNAPFTVPNGKRGKTDTDALLTGASVLSAHRGVPRPSTSVNPIVSLPNPSSVSGVKIEYTSTNPCAQMLSGLLAPANSNDTLLAACVGNNP